MKRHREKKNMSDYSINVMSTQDSSISVACVSHMITGQ